jgi:hypothetical protein
MIVLGPVQKPKVLESTVKIEVKKRLNKMGAYHFWPVQMGLGATTLDCLGCYKSKFFAIETKAPGKSLTPRQRVTMADMRRAGAIVFIIDGTDQYGYDQLDYLQGSQAIAGPTYGFDQGTVAKDEDA